MKSKTVHLIIPGLFNSFQPSECDFSVSGHRYLIQKYVSRSTHIPSVNAGNSVIPVRYHESFPLAFYENFLTDNKQRPVIYAEPVNLELKTDHIVAFPVDVNNSDFGKIKKIITVFNNHFSEDGLTLALLESGKIVCYSDTAEFPEMTPVYSVYGRDIKHFLPQGEHARFWLRVFNEVQMLLHENCSPEDKDFNNRLLNGFWFWGSAKPSKISTEYAMTGNPNWLKGYCQFNEIARYEFSEIETIKEQNIVVVDESLLLSSSCGDFNDWLNKLGMLEQALFIPLEKLLVSGVVDQINIHKPSGDYCQYKKNHRYHFFKKIRPLSDVCLRDL